MYSETEQVLNTQYPKILKLKTNEKEFPLDEILDTLSPYCIYDETKKELYRNRDKMVAYIKEEFLEEDDEGRIE